jgi:hypothetical protein
VRFGDRRVSTVAKLPAVTSPQTVSINRKPHWRSRAARVPSTNEPARLNHRNARPFWDQIPHWERAYATKTTNAAESWVHDSTPMASVYGAAPGGGLVRTEMDWSS